MKNSIIKTSLLIGLLGHFGSALAADKFDYVNLLKDGIAPNDGKVWINPVNGKYGTASKTTVPYSVKIRAGCKGNNMVKVAYAAFGAVTTFKTGIEANDNYTKGVATGLTKVMDWKSVTLDVPLNKLGFNPAQKCQDYVNAQLGKGHNLQQILSQDHIINVPVKLSAVARCGKISQDGDHYGSTQIGSGVQIICKAGSVGGLGNIQQQQPKPPSQMGPGSFQKNGQVTQLTFQPVQYHTTGTCPTKVKFDGTISMDGPGEVEYYIHFPGADKTSVKKLIFNAAGKRAIQTAEWMADKTYPTASARLEIVSPVSKKLYKHFKVTCVAAEGQNTIQNNGQGGNALPKLKIGTQPKPAPQPARAPTR